jgi:hypothetical protein
MTKRHPKDAFRPNPGTKTQISDELERFHQNLTKSEVILRILYFPGIVEIYLGFHSKNRPRVSLRAVHKRKTYNPHPAFGHPLPQGAKEGGVFGDHASMRLKNATRQL